MMLHEEPVRPLILRDELGARRHPPRRPRMIFQHGKVLRPAQQHRLRQGSEMHLGNLLLAGTWHGSRLGSPDAVELIVIGVVDPEHRFPLAAGHGGVGEVYRMRAVVRDSLKLNRPSSMVYSRQSHAGG